MDIFTTVDLEVKQESKEELRRDNHCCRFCPACGSKLKPVEEVDEDWWDIVEPVMRSCGTDYLLCTNTDCWYSDSPLVVHHPVYGCDRAPGESWAIGWLK